MFVDGKIWMGKNETQQLMIPKMSNRHGLIAGATGTGKTVTLKVMAESFSDMGVPVFMADVKGDLSGMCVPGADSESMQKRIEKFGLKDYNFSYHEYPTAFWDVYGEKGLPVRTTISEMGPLLLSHVMGLNDTQTGIMEIIFQVADDEHLLLLDLKDLKAILNYVSEHAEEFRGEYGNIASQSVGAIMRGVLRLEQQGGEQFFGEPALDMKDWMRTDANGRGYINILDGVKLFQNPALYATFLLWMLSELYEMMPEMGDADKPKMIFFFDEAHLLFGDAPKALLQKVEQIVRLIRSKGVGVYFISQKPTDIPDDILSQLGNRIQHALHAYSPAEQKAVKAAAESFCANPAFDTKEAIMELGTGEALVSFLDESGKPQQVERTFILPPQSFMGAAPEETWKQLWQTGEMSDKYTTAIDRESAYELLSIKARKAGQTAQEQEAKPDASTKAEEKLQKENEKLQEQLEKQKEKEEALKEKQKEKEEQRKEKEREKKEQKIHRELENSLIRVAKSALPRTSYGRKKSAADRIKDTAINAAGGEVVKSLIRGLFGILKK